MRFAVRSPRYPGALRIAACCALLAVATPAMAQSPCTCRAAGASFALDACTCLNTPAGPRMACCGKVLNNTAWRFTDRLCPTAAAPERDTAGKAPTQRRASYEPTPLPPHSAAGAFR